METKSPIQFIIGLGNPGDKYQHTRHNFGRDLVHSSVSQKNLKWNKERLFDWTDSHPRYIQLNTFMNLSGEAVSAVLTKFHSSPSHILVCYDDFDLPLGSIRIRKKGSAGSHNGVKSIIEHLKTQDFSRLRLGIGPLLPDQDPADFVLKPFLKSEQKQVQLTLVKASDAIETIFHSGLDTAMNQFNKK